MVFFFFFQAEDGIRDLTVTGVQTCALPISGRTIPQEDRARARWERSVHRAGGRRRRAGGAHRRGRAAREQRPELHRGEAVHRGGAGGGPLPDRKSTRLNSSHSQISYAVFCLKKKQALGNETE